MRQSDIGPFGVVDARADPAAAGRLPGGAARERTAAGSALWTAVVVARLAMARTGLPGVPIAEGSSLGGLVAGTVSTAWFAGCARRRRRCLVGAAVLVPGEVLALAARLVGSAAAGLLAAEVAPPPRPRPAGRRDRRRDGCDGRDGDRGRPAGGRGRRLSSAAAEETLDQPADAPAGRRGRPSPAHVPPGRHAPATGRDVPYRARAVRRVLRASRPGRRSLQCPSAFRECSWRRGALTRTSRPGLRSAVARISAWRDAPLINGSVRVPGSAAAVPAAATAAAAAAPAATSPAASGVRPPVGHPAADVDRS